jgi:hypothetical protein
MKIAHGDLVTGSEGAAMFAPSVAPSLRCRCGMAGVPAAALGVAPQEVRMVHRHFKIHESEAGWKT